MSAIIIKSSREDYNKIINALKVSDASCPFNHHYGEDHQPICLLKEEDAKSLRGREICSKCISKNIVWGRWFPEENDTCYYIDINSYGNFLVESRPYSELRLFVQGLYNEHNLFQTKKEAEEMLGNLKRTMKGEC